MKKLISLVMLLSINVINCSPIVARQEKQIKLYTYPICPSCIKVKNFLEKNNWSNRVVFLNANEPKHYADLLRISKKDFCPYLVDEVHSINKGDSKKIIEHFITVFN